MYIAVVISHDCDIAEQDIEAEPFIEVVIGRWIDSCDPNLSNSKSTRLLHLEVEVGEEHRPVELQIIKRASVRNKAGDVRLLAGQQIHTLVRQQAHTTKLACRSV